MRVKANRLDYALPGVRCDGAEMVNQTRELDPVHTGVRRAQLYCPWSCQLKINFLSMRYSGNVLFPLFA